MPSRLAEQFTAHLDADVYALVAHSILVGDRQLVREPDPDETLRFRAVVDRLASTVRLLGFPPVTDRVATDLGRVSATVTLDGEPEGAFHDESGHVEIEVTLRFDPDHFLASASRVTITLSSTATIREEELEADGDPFTVDDGTLILVGEGTFERGTLDGGRVWVAISCAIEEIEEYTEA